MQEEKRIHISAVLERAAILAALWVCAVFIRRYLPNSALILPLAALVSLLLALAWAFPARAKAAGDFCFRYRWALALMVFCLCVCLRLHGSSIGVYDEVFPTQTEAEETTLFGAPRWIRSDEYGVTTPKYFSQAANGYRLYSQQMSLSETNMVLDYYSPVRDWTILGKPMAWGFLLFGNEIGLSWYWCMEIILLFMTALEMCLILTGGHRLTSLLGAFMVTLSPAIQWWVMPHMPPVILYTMALFCVGYWFFTAEGALSRWASAALSLVAALGFALSIFPSFQVPCAYTALTLLIVCLWRDRAKFRFARRDWLRLALPVAAALLILGRFVLQSREELSLLLNTVYPGHRVSLGGDGRLRELFASPHILLLPYQDASILNNCELSGYIHFAPFFLALSPKLIHYLKGRDDGAASVGKALTAILLAEVFFILVGIPQWLAELTLLRFCNRLYYIYQWTGTLYTVWGLAVLLRYPELLSRREKLLYPLSYAAFHVLLVDDEVWQVLHFVIHGVDVWPLLFVIGVLAFTLCLLLAAFQKKRLLSALLVLLMFFSGATVNPVERGTGAVTNHPISAAIAEIAASEPESRWFCTDCAVFFANFVTANGARAVDATNFYPDTEKWAILDPTGEYEEITNRYANISAWLTAEETSVELIGADQVGLHLNPEDLKALGVRYLFSGTDHTELLASCGIACEYLTGQDGYGIYRLTYEA